jgi:hypothetical protein
LTNQYKLALSVQPVPNWEQGIACQVKSHLCGCEENGNQLNEYMDYDVHIDIYVIAIIQHKACTRRWLKGNRRTAMALRNNICGPVSYWREHLDGRNLRLSSPATFAS